MTQCKYCKHYELDRRYCPLRDIYTALDTLNEECEDYERICDEYMQQRAVDSIIEGKKYDTDKNRMGLVLQGFSNALWEVGKVGTFGANKYGDNNWMYLDNAKDRYLDALCRHLFQYMEGYYYDGESNLPHLAHMCWNALALLKFESESVHEPPMEVEDGR